jgi:hypothetical protein
MKATRFVELYKSCSKYQSSLPFVTLFIRDLKNNDLKMLLGSVVVKALCYKPEGREFDTR